MRKLIIALMALSLVACTVNKEAVKMENSQQPAAVLQVQKAPETKAAVVLKEVDSVNVEAGIGSIKISWEMADVSGIDGFEILYKGESTSFKKIKIADKNAKEYMLKGLEPLDNITIKLKTSSGDLRSTGLTKKAFTQHKNVVVDEFDGRKMYIYLPDGYNESAKKFPVMYMFDGQNLFSKAIVAEDWGVDETLEKLVGEGKVEKMIVVGIFNAGDKRTEEYTPYLYPLGKEYAEKLVKGYMPYIEGKYKALPGKENRGIMGSSRGGLMALYMINNYSDYFGFGAGVSPSEMWKYKEYKNFPKKDVKIWVDNGTADYVLGYARSVATREMVDGYMTQGHEYGKTLAFYEVKDSIHNEVDWAKRVAYPFIMFKGKEIGTAKDYKIDVEVFHDNENKPVFAANPVGELENGMKMSLYKTAKYAISGKAAIDDKGIFIMNGEKDATIFVTYNGVTKEAKITVEQLEKMRKSNLESK